MARALRWPTLCIYPVMIREAVSTLQAHMVSCITYIVMPPHFPDSLARALYWHTLCIYPVLIREAVSTSEMSTHFYQPTWCYSRIRLYSYKCCPIYVTRWSLVTIDCAVGWIPWVLELNLC